MIHSNATYLSLSEPKKAQSQAGGHIGAVYTEAKIIRAVMSLAAEAKLGGLFINAKTAVPI